VLADELDYVVGVDTHRDEHVLAVVTAPAGAVLAGSEEAAKQCGYRAALRFAERHAAGRRAWAIEGTGSYGAGLARFLADRGELVLELSRTPRAERRLRGKDDVLDAVRTARTALTSETLALPRADERREALRLLLVARRSAVDVRREALTQPRAVIVTAPEPLREQLRKLPLGQLTPPRLQRPDNPAPAQPRRRPPTQPRPPHHRPPPPPARPGNPRLHRQEDRRRQEPPRRQVSRNSTFSAANRFRASVMKARARTKRVRLSRLLASSGPGQSFPVGITVAGSTISKTVRPCARGW